jgi:4-amino-4-deoxy-L-arabinose transferase-like glycosyltransferase
MKKELIIVGVIFVISLLIRIVALDIRPMGFTWDEAALGYNAFSLLKTGRDEHQQILPIIFKSFGDYKPGAYVYLTVPAIGLLGMTETATRLPSAIFGALLSVVVWILVKKMFPTLTNVWLVSVVMAVNPWSIYFSRGAWEANVMVFLLTMGMCLLLSKKFVWASIFLGLTFWTYQGAKMITPLLILGWILVWGRQAIFHKKIILPVLILGFFLLPILLGLKTQSGRLEVFSVFSYVRPKEVVERVVNQDKSAVGSPLYYLFHSELLDQVRGITQRYLNHYSPRFLFIEGDWTSFRHSIAYYGYLHIPELLLLIIGITWLLRNWSNPTKFIFYWLIVAAIPSALSRDLVSGVRSLPEIIPLIILIGVGATQLFKRKILFLGFSLVFLFFLTYFLDLYFKHAPNYGADERVAFYKLAIQQVNKYSGEYDKIIFTNKFGQPYIFTLFYNQVSPVEFWQTVQRSDSSGPDVGEVQSYGKWRFERFYWPQTRAEKSVLVVGDEFELPVQDLNQENLIRLGEISYPNGVMAVREVGLK